MGVLVPREDTEVLVRASADIINSRKLKTGIDLCAGSGAISLGISALCPQTDITAVELFPDAFNYLIQNTATTKNIKSIQGDVLSPDFVCSFKSKFDFILSNPPYISHEEYETLEADVLKEPPAALKGGEDGLRFYRGITCLWKNLLLSGGLIAFEIGETQADAVSSILDENGFSDIRVYKDLSGHDRAVTALSTV